MKLKGGIHGIALRSRNRAGAQRKTFHKKKRQKTEHMGTWEYGSMVRLPEHLQAQRRHRFVRMRGKGDLHVVSKNQGGESVTAKTHHGH